MNHLSRILSGLVVVAVGLGLPIRAQAASVNVDFNDGGPLGTYGSTGAAPDLGTVWNGITPSGVPFTSGFLDDSVGNPTTVKITLSDSYGLYDTTDDLGTGTHIAGFAPALLDDFAYAPTSPVGFIISGLNSGDAYDLYLYAQNGGYYADPAGQKTEFTIGTDTEHIDNNIAGVGGGFVLGGNYASYLGLVADGGGTISGSWAGDGVANGTFDGFQILPSVPEPASMAVLACGGLMLLRRRARR